MRVLLLFLAAGLAVVGCARSPQVTELTVTMTEFGFEPSELTVIAGQPVRMTLVNGGSLEHDFSIMEFPMQVGSGERLAPEAGEHVMEMTMDPEFHSSALAGESTTQEFTPTGPGAYEFFCTVAGHREAGMTGTLTVLAPE